MKETQTEGDYGGPIIKVEFVFYSITGQPVVTMRCNEYYAGWTRPACYVEGENVYFGSKQLVWGRCTGGDGPARQHKGEHARGANVVLPVWGRADGHGRWKRQVRDVLPGRGGAGLRGATVLRGG